MAPSRHPCTDGLPIPCAQRSPWMPCPVSTTSRSGTDTVTIRTRDSDAAARYLLTHTNATDLEITSHNLEDAFLALTTDAGAASDDEQTRPAEEGTK